MTRRQAVSSARDAAAVAELVDPLTAVEAGKLTHRIGLRLAVIAENYEAVLPLIREAITRDAHTALGYPSVSAYVADRFGDSLSRLGVEVRREVVRELTDAGLSSRAIAPVVGVSQQQVTRDRLAAADQVTPKVSPGGETSGNAAQAPASSTSTSAAKVTGRDGKRYPRTPTPQPRPPAKSSSARPSSPATLAGRDLRPVVKAARAAVGDLVTALQGVDAAMVEKAERRCIREAHDELAAVLDRIDPSGDPDLTAAAADIETRAGVDVDTAREIARRVQARNAPDNLAGYVRCISREDLLSRYLPPRTEPAAPECPHQRAGGRRVVGRGVNASRVCDRCEAEDPAVREEAAS